jgi:fucose permease
MLGFGGGLLNGAANALLNDISAERRSSALNLLGIYFGIGALLTPFAIGVLIGNLGLSTILLGFAVFSIAPAPLFLLALFPAPKHEGGISWKDCARMLSKPILLLFGLLLFFQSGNEFTIGGWVSTYLGERFTLDADYCAYALVGYWLAMMLGRWTASRMGRVSPSRLVLYSSSVALLACAGLILAPNSIAAVALVAAVGFGFAAIFPAVLAQAGEAFAGYSGTAFSIIFVMALTGGMTTPWLVGNIAQSHGVGAGLWVVVFNCAAIFFLQGLIRRRSAKEEPI